MNILITGGLGFVGNHLVRHLVGADLGHRVTVIDDGSSGRMDFLSDITDLFTLYDVDTCNKEELERCFDAEKPDVVVHLAAIHFIPECDRDPKKTWEVNVAGTGHVVDLVNQFGVGQLIFASSASVYGPNLEANTELDVPNPFDVYGRSKLAGEELIMTRCMAPWTILRFFNVIGPNETHPHLLPRIMDQLKLGDRIQLGNTTTRRDFIFMKDLVSGIVEAMHDPHAYGEVFNLGTGVGTSANEIVRALEVLLKRQITIVQNVDLVRKVDNPVLIASIEKIKKALGWAPKYDIADALQETLLAS